MNHRTRFEASIDKKNAVDKAEKDGKIADSMDVRLSIMSRVHSGEITLLEAQEELKNIKKNASKNGMTTRSKLWSKS